MEAEYFSMYKDEDYLRWDCIADAVQEYVDDGGTENEVVIYGFKRKEFTDKVKLQYTEDILTRLYEWISTYYGDCDVVNEPNDEIKQLAKTLIDKITENYNICQYDVVGQQTVKVSDYVLTLKEVDDYVLTLKETDFMVHHERIDGFVEDFKDTGGKKFDDGKLKWELLDIDFVENIVTVLTFGAKKYGDNNWRDLPNKNGTDRCYAALLRHLAAWRRGEKVDPESGLSHLHHMACNVYFLSYFDKIKEESNL